LILSNPSTSSPLWASLDAVKDPIKPAVPVTRILIELLSPFAKLNYTFWKRTCHRGIETQKKQEVYLKSPCPLGLMIV
jgi:hypothetical protein